MHFAPEHTPVLNADKPSSVDFAPNAGTPTARASVRWRITLEPATIGDPADGHGWWVGSGLSDEDPLRDHHTGFIAAQSDFWNRVHGADTDPFWTFADDRTTPLD